jgi:GrpB-like predicted nucleotidyltransferase (UPF0157 family)
MVIRKRTWTLPPSAEPVTDEYLAAVAIGDRQPLNDQVRLAAYDARWPSQYAWAAEQIRASLTNRAHLLEHVGSTSVPGLAAKPIIDMVLGVADSTDEESYVPALQEIGFELRSREPDWYEHRFLRLISGDMQWSLHVFSVECEEIDRMLAFRDWLRAHPDDRQKYEGVKRELAARTWRHVQNYADAKSSIVREILGRAHKEAGSERQRGSGDCVTGATGTPAVLQSSCHR